MNSLDQLILHPELNCVLFCNFTCDEPDEKELKGIAFLYMNMANSLKHGLEKYCMLTGYMIRAMISSDYDWTIVESTIDQNICQIEYDDHIITYLPEYGYVYHSFMGAFTLKRECVIPGQITKDKAINIYHQLIHDEVPYDGVVNITIPNEKVDINLNIQPSINAWLDYHYRDKINDIEKNIYEKILNDIPSYESLIYKCNDPNIISAFEKNGPSVMVEYNKIHFPEF